MARYKKRVRVDVWRKGWREEKKREKMNELKRLFSFFNLPSVFRAADQPKQHRLNVMVGDGESLAWQRDEHESSAGATTLTSALHAADSHTVRPGFILTSGSLRRPLSKRVLLQVHAVLLILQQELQLQAELCLLSIEQHPGLELGRRRRGRRGKIHS